MCFGQRKAITVLDRPWQCEVAAYVSPLSSTLIGSLPWSSASMSDGLHEWKAPLQMNRMWSVLTLPYLVDTTEPSMMGSRSLWTPSELASAPVDTRRACDSCDINIEWLKSCLPEHSLGWDDWQWWSTSGWVFFCAVSQLPCALALSCADLWQIKNSCMHRKLLRPIKCHIRITFLDQKTWTKKHGPKNMDQKTWIKNKTFLSAASALQFGTESF